jgi:RNA polymerase sigma factor (sigma-70 family)
MRGMERDASSLVDELLVMRYQDGDVEAGGALVDRWHGRLWAYAARMTGQPDGANDVVQESWLAIVRGIRKLTDPASFRSWAYRIETNKSADWVRKRSRDRNRRDAMPADVTDASASQAESAGDLASDIRTAMDALPADQRITAGLYYLDNLSVAEIAEVTQVPRGTVKSRLHAARGALAHWIATHMPADT